MGTITLPNFRTTADVKMNTKLKDGGVYIEWSSLTDIKAWIWSDAQKALAGRVDVSVDTGDATVLKCLYASTKPQYPGVNRLIVQGRYNGSLKTYDKPVFNFVPRTAEATGSITISDPEVDVEIEVTDTTSSILDNTIAAALAAAAHAEHAASLVPLQVLQDCEQATIEADQARDDADAAAEHATPYIGENGHWWRWSKETGAYVDTGEVAQGPTGNGIQSVEQTQTSEESEGENVVTVTMTDGTQAQFVIRNGKQGEQGIQGQPGVANAKYKQVETLPEASAETLDFIYLTPSQTASVFNMSYTEQDGNTYTWKPLGTTAIQLADYATKAEFSQLQQDVTELTTEGESTRRESTEFVIAYPVTAGGSNGKTINVNLKKGGSYGLLVEDVDTGNTGGFGFDPTPSGSIQGLNNTCTIGKERGFNATANITALTIRDINSSITTSGNMRIVIRSLASNESRINNRDNVELNFSTRLYGSFINGSYSAGNYQTYRAQYRICSQGLLKYDRDVTIKAKAGYKFGVQTFTSGGVYSADSGWVTTYNVPANTYFKFVLTTTNDNVPLGVEDIENIVISTLLDEKTNTGDNSISVTGKGGTGVLTTVSFPSKKVKIKIPSPWPITNVGNVLNNVLTVGYVKGGVSCDLQALTKTEMDSYFEKEFVVIFPEFDYDSTYIFLRADSGATAKVEWEEYHDYDLIDSGRNYEGEIIRPKSRFALSQIGQLKNFGTIDETKLNAQGMAVYEDRYILQGSNRVGVGSHLLVVDTKTPSVSMLTIETLAEGQGFHMNNVNLGNKYDATDTLPLVYCSECYNQHACKVLRIANDFSSFTEVQTISYSGSAIDTTTYDWVVDAEKNLLYLISFPVSGIKMLCFNLPSTSNASVTLTDADVLETINIPNTSGKTILSQGGTIINGKLWTVFGSDTVGYPGFLAVSDIESRKMVSLADLSGLGEAEAVSPYKEGVLLCVASGLVPSGASLKNPSYVYMIFNN